MFSLVIWNTTFELDCNEWLTVKEYRKILPIMAEQDFKINVEVVIGAVKILCLNYTPEEAENLINDMDLSEMTELIEKVTELLDSKKKTKE